MDYHLNAPKYFEFWGGGRGYQWLDGGTGDFFMGGQASMGEESPSPIPPILDNPATLLDHESDLGSSLQYITDHKSTF